jgi:hypothetical protein
MCKNLNFCRSDSLTTQGIYCLDMQNCCYYKESSMTKPLPVLPHMHGGRGRVDMYAKLLKTYWKQMNKPNAHETIYQCVFRSWIRVQRVDTTFNTANDNNSREKNGITFLTTNTKCSFQNSITNQLANNPSNKLTLISPPYSTQQVAGASVTTVCVTFQVKHEER